MNWFGGAFIIALAAIALWMSSSVGESGAHSPPTAPAIGAYSSAEEQEHFSVSPVSPWEEIVGATLIEPSGSAVQSSSLGGDFLAVYFSASWCPPCRRFLPVLKEFYQSSKGTVQVVLMGQDQTPSARESYYRNSGMPWKSVPFDSPLPDALALKMGVRGIPSLVVFDRRGNIVSDDGATDIMKSPGSVPLSWQPQ